MRISNNVLSALLLVVTCLFFSCTPANIEGSWDFKLLWNEDRPSFGVLKINNENGIHSAILNSFQLGKLELQDFEVSGNSVSGNFEKWDDHFVLEGRFSGDHFKGSITAEDRIRPISATRQSMDTLVIDRSEFEYILADNDLEETELNIDHAKLIEDSGQESFQRGERIYNSNCINCHGNPEIEGSIPLSLKFWEQAFKAGSDPFSMYQSISKGYATMPPQLTLAPQEKYDVITYIREAYIRENNPDQYFNSSVGYLAGLPEGTSTGPEPKPYHPWSDQDYGNFFINTYELVDTETGPERYHSPGPTPYEDEDYSQNNFAYKGIALRLDEGEGGVSDGKAWMIFDHDLMRVAGGWTGEGFIDWDAILLNDRHETYPRTIGKLHFETPVGPGWANPEDGTFEDPRFTARDGRKFGPLPKVWADYKGLYHHGDHIIISYSVGTADILEQLGMEKDGEQIVFTRTLNISPSSSLLKLRVAKDHINVRISGKGGALTKEDGFIMMNVNKGQAARIKLFIADAKADIDAVVKASSAPRSLAKYTKGGPAHYPEEINSVITKGSDDHLFAVDQLSPPYDNPWNCRMKLSGIDFMKDGNKAVACTTDGDVWLITGLTDGGTTLKWKRIGAGLFQPLGIKVVDEQIFVTCRDQLVRLRDFNGDDETDFYESFNHDHQVSDHFHEFAMGLQADEEGNLYYAKSGRHAREALIPQHGTLIKVSKDGSESEIIATGFRAANGVCLNPDGSFLVTDQQGYWNPMNRINWIETGKEPKFYGNMWGYGPPQDTTRLAMEQPMVWVDMEFDRSPSELLWVDSDKWGPLDGGLLSFSYGYGKIQWVLNEEVEGQRQGGVIDIPGMKFYTGVMRGRFHPDDQHLYLCGMEAWSTSQNMRTGDLYRIRYTGKTIPMPIKLNALGHGMQLTFASKLNEATATDVSNYEVKTWDLVRSRKYGSDRHNVKTLDISEARLTEDGTGVTLLIKDIEPVDVMTISYDISDEAGTPLKGTVQNTIHILGKEPDGKKSVAMVLPQAD
jgi:cytochrome c5